MNSNEPEDKKSITPKSTELETNKINFTENGPAKNKTNDKKKVATEPSETEPIDINFTENGPGKNKPDDKNSATLETSEAESINIDFTENGPGKNKIDHKRFATQTHSEEEPININFTADGPGSLAATDEPVTAKEPEPDFSGINFANDKPRHPVEPSKTESENEKSREGEQNVEEPKFVDTGTREPKDNGFVDNKPVPDFLNRISEETVESKFDTHDINVDDNSKEGESLDLEIVIDEAEAVVPEQFDVEADNKIIDDVNNDNDNKLEIDIPESFEIKIEEPELAEQKTIKTNDSDSIKAESAEKTSLEANSPEPSTDEPTTPKSEPNNLNREHTETFESKLFEHDKTCKEETKLNEDAIETNKPVENETVEDGASTTETPDEVPVLNETNEQQTVKLTKKEEKEKAKREKTEKLENAKKEKLEEKEKAIKEKAEKRESIIKAKLEKKEEAKREKEEKLGTVKTEETKRDETDVLTENQIEKSDIAEEPTSKEPEEAKSSKTKETKSEKAERLQNKKKEKLLLKEKAKKEKAEKHEAAKKAKLEKKEEAKRKKEEKHEATKKAKQEKIEAAKRKKEEKLGHIKTIESVMPEEAESKEIAESKKPFETESDIPVETASEKPAETKSEKAARIKNEKNVKLEEKEKAKKEKLEQKEKAKREKLEKKEQAKREKAEKLENAKREKLEKNKKEPFDKIILMPGVLESDERPAGFWLRLTAFQLDMFILWLITIIAEFGLAAALSPTTITFDEGFSTAINQLSSYFTTTQDYTIVSIIFIVIPFIYNICFWSGKGATPGKMLVGIKVKCGKEMKPLSPLNSFIRTLGYIVSSVPLLIGFIWAGFNKQKLTWHDNIAKSRVIRTKKSVALGVIIAIFIPFIPYIVAFALYTESMMVATQSISIESIESMIAKGSNALNVAFTEGINKGLNDLMTTTTSEPPVRRPVHKKEEKKPLVAVNSAGAEPKTAPVKETVKESVKAEVIADKSPTELIENKDNIVEVIDVDEVKVADKKLSIVEEEATDAVTPPNDANISKPEKESIDVAEGIKEDSSNVGNKVAIVDETVNRELEAEVQTKVGDNLPKTEEVIAASNNIPVVDKLIEIVEKTDEQDNVISEAAEPNEQLEDNELLKVDDIADIRVAVLDSNLKAESDIFDDPEKLDKNANTVEDEADNVTEAEISEELLEEKKQRDMSAQIILDDVDGIEPDNVPVEVALEILSKLAKISKTTATNSSIPEEIKRETLPEEKPTDVKPATENESVEILPEILSHQDEVVELKKRDEIVIEKDVTEEKSVSDDVVIETDEELGNRYLDIAKNHYQNGNFPQATHFLENAIEANPNVAEFHSLLGTIFEKQDNDEDAIEEYKKTIDIDPYHVSAYLNLGHLFYTKGLKLQAIDPIKKAIELDPNNADAHMLLGVVYQRFNMLNEAVTEHKQALRISPYLAQPHINLGNIYFKKNKNRKAIKEYKRAIKLNPNLAEAHNNLGFVYYNTGKNNKAINEFKKTIELKYEYKRAHKNLSMAYKRTGMIEDANREEQIVKQLP